MNDNRVITKEYVGVVREGGKVIKVLCKHNGDACEIYNTTPADFEEHMAILSGKDEPLIPKDTLNNIKPVKKDVV